MGNGEVGGQVKRDKMGLNHFRPSSGQKKVLESTLELLCEPQSLGAVASTLGRLDAVPISTLSLHRHCAVRLGGFLLN